MPTSYPTALDTLTNPTANDSLNSPSVPHATQHANANDAIEALQTTVGITNSADASSIQYKLAGTISVANSASSTASTALSTAQSAMPNTTTAAGTLLYGATAKNTPVDADVLAISDSAASNVLKKLSWANLKSTVSTALESVFAKLSGLAGGQTLIGGTAPSENLTLQSTAHATRGKLLFGSSAAYDEVNVRLGIGTQAPSGKIHVIGTTEQLRLGYDASNYLSVTASSNGTPTFDSTARTYTFLGQTSNNSYATSGAELVTNGGFTSDLSSWSDSGSTWSWVSGAASHTAGSASTLSQSVTVTNGSTYVIDFSITNRTAGTISISLGAANLIQAGTSTSFSASDRKTVAALASGSVTLSIVPSATFDGRIDSISVKELSLGTVPAVLAINNDTLESVSVRVNRGASSIAIGRDAMRSFTSGSSANLCIAQETGYSITTGYSNVLMGWQSGYGLTIGFRNTAIGVSSGYAWATCYDMVAVGTSAARNITASAQTVCIGSSAGRYLANGSSSLTAADNSVYIGFNAKASADSVVNENVFGYNATGIGSNSTCIGSSAVTKCQIYGDIILDKTVTAGGTTGAQTINKTCGSVNFAASATSLVVTNNRVTTSSVIVATVATNDTTMKSVQAVAASGSFTLYANAAATAETRVNWIVLN